MTSIKQQLDTMLKRSLSLCGYSLNDKGERVPKHEAVENFLKTLAADTTSQKEMADKIIAAWDDKTGTLQKALSAARIEQIGNFIAAESTFKSAFFSTVTLAPDEEPFYVNETLNETRVGAIGDDGTPERVRVVRPQERTAVGLYLVASDIVRVKTQDLYRGDVSQSALATINIARDMRFKLDRVFFNLLTASVANGGCFGAFSYEQARTNKATRIYLAHSGIDTSHLPLTNEIVNGTTAGPTGTRGTVRYYDSASTTLVGFRPSVLLSIVDYADRWADVLPGGGRLMPTGDIIVPASDIISMALYMDLTKVGTTQTAMQEQIQNQGYSSLTLFGKTWRFIPDVTIAAGTCYPRFNMLPGIAYEKPNWNREFTNRNDIENWEERWQRAAHGGVIPAQWRPRAISVKYIA
jgi:hypothetical protein